MKSKLLNSLCLLLSWFSHSQSELYVLMKTPQNNTRSNGTCRVGSYRDSYDITYREGSFAITGNSTVIKVDYQEGYNDDPGFDCNGPCGAYSEYCNGVEIQRTLNHFGEYENIYTGEDPIECTSNTCKPISYFAVLLPKLTTPSDRICEKKPIFPTHSDGVNHNVSGLTWQFYSSAGRWEDIPTFKNRFPLNVSLLNIFGNNWRTRFNGNLQLRYKLNNSFSSSTIYSRSTYTIVLTECSPELVGEILPIHTRCNYTTDGKFTMTVNRNLVANEKLVVSLYEENVLNGTYFFRSQESTGTLVNNSNGTYSYTWNQDIDSGNYNIKFQTLLGGGSSIPSTDPSWATLEFSDEFTILNPNELDFNVVKLNDETCFNSGNGKIRINILDNEPGRSFQYKIYKVSGTSITTFRDWTNFSTSSFEIDSLDKNIYRIKVRDNEECYAR